MDETAIRIAVLSDHIDDVDYYALLEIARDASSEAVREGFHQFALRFHPDQHMGDPVRKKQALAIFKRGAEAYRVLMQPTLRKRYDESLARGSVRLEPSAMQLPAEQTAANEVPSAARAFYDKAQEALSRGDLGGAKMHLGLAKAKGSSPAFETLAQKIAAAERAKKK